MRWREEQHPRRPDGRFRRKGASGGWAEAASDSMTRGYTPVRGRDLTDELDWGRRVPGLGFGQSDLELGKIFEAQGYDGPPEVIDRDEMDRRVAAGWPEMWRGVGEARIHRSDETGSHTTVVTPGEHAEQFRSGGYYPGSGVFGNGTYASVDPVTAMGYLSGGIGDDLHSTPGMLRIAVRPDARVIDFDDLLELYPHLRPVNTAAEHGLLDETGRLAAALGYDAIAAQPRNPDYRDGRIMYWVILNRTAVAVQEARHG